MRGSVRVYATGLNIISKIVGKAQPTAKPVTTANGDDASHETASIAVDKNVITAIINADAII